jgi:hypothetical protein
MFGTIKKFLQSFNLKENNKPLIFLVCLLIATILWFVKALEKDYETIVSMPIQYTNLPLNKVLLNPPPSRLNVKVKAQGFVLLRHKLGLTFSPINFNINTLTKTTLNKKNPTNFFVLSDQYISQISNQVNSEISIRDISPDTLFFHFDKLSEKKVRVISKLNISFQDHYNCSDSVKLSPSQIIVRGPSSIVDTLTGVYTKNQRFNNINATINQNIMLEKIEQLEFSTYKINLEIPVSLQSEKKMKDD